MTPLDKATASRARADGGVILVGGGVRCGKSSFALSRAKAMGERRGFIATATAFDEEMRERIANHKSERDGSFTTVEAPTAIGEALGNLRSMDVVVIDCLTLWLSNLLLEEPSDVEMDAAMRSFLEALRARDGHTILVTNEVGLGIVPATPLGRRFRDLAGRLHQSLVAEADEIYFGALGAMLRLRPDPICLVSPFNRAPR